MSDPQRFPIKTERIISFLVALAVLAFFCLAWRV